MSESSQQEPADLIPPLTPRSERVDVIGQLQLTHLSFGMAEGYRKHGGHAVLTDECPLAQPIDLTAIGLRLPEDSSQGRTVLAAFTQGFHGLRLRISARFNAGYEPQVTIRAFSNGDVRVAETVLRISTKGEVQTDVKVTGLAADGVRTIDESWSWEWSADGSGFLPVDLQSESQQTVPVRIYVTAAAPLQASRESYFHIACAVPGATTAGLAERDIWAGFTGFHRAQHLTNVRGQRLSYWGDRNPGPQDLDYINRNAQDLVVKGDSSCRGWSELLRAVFAVHGIVSNVRAIRPKLSLVQPRLGLPSFQTPDNQGGKRLQMTIGMLIKPFRWSPRSQVPAHNPAPQPNSMVRTGSFIWRLNNPSDPYCARWPSPDVTDLLRPGPGAEAGRVTGLFGNHAIVRVDRPDGTHAWYDPNFGFGPHPTLQAYESDALGHGEEDSGGLFAIVGWRNGSRPHPTTGEPMESFEGVFLGAAPSPAGPVLEELDPGPIAD